MLYPKISVITPSFNQAKFLEKTILSVLNQNYPCLEYIIIDGGSTDGSLEIIKKYQRYITYWVSESDSGQVDAINKGLRQATGELLSWQNSDDIYLPGAFYKVADSYKNKKNKDIDIFYGYVYLIDEEDEIINYYKLTRFDYRAWLYNVEVVFNQSCFFTRSFLKRVGYLSLDYSICFDEEFFTRANNRLKTCLIKEYLGAYRIHNIRKTEIYGNSIGIEEKKKILKKYGIRFNSLNYKLKRSYFIIRKFFLLLFAGEFYYIIQKIIKKIIR